VNARPIAAALVSFGLASCVVPDVTHWNGYMNGAQLEGRSRAEVLAELGPPAALRDDGSVLMYALPDNDWVLVLAFHFVGAVFALDPHWDVRFVAFDSHGVVQVATPKQDRDVTLDELVEELTSGRWRARAKGS
jgi:hypothetical protein